MHRVCFVLASTYPIGHVGIDYQAYHQFRVTNNNEHTIKIP